MRRRNIDTRKFSERRASRGCHSCRRAAQQTLEIFFFPGSNADLEKASRKVWPDVTYKGQDIVDFIVEYSGKIRKRFVNLQSLAEGDFTWMQECYGGYDIKSDTYYMGFDASINELVEYEEEDEDGYFEYEEVMEDVGGWVLFKIKNGKIELGRVGRGMFYDSGSSGYSLTSKMGLADLRLD